MWLQKSLNNNRFIEPISITFTEKFLTEALSKNNALLVVLKPLSSNCTNFHKFKQKIIIQIFSLRIFTSGAVQGRPPYRGGS